MNQNKKIGLALSGGGYRAAAFHLGTLRKLDELGVLKKIDVISCISGGSIIGAYYSINQDQNFKDIEHSFSSLLKRSVTIRLKIILYLIIFILMSLVIFIWWTGYHLTSLLVLGIFFFVFLKNQFTILPSSKIVEKIYENFFFDKKKISDLSKKTSLLINATNLETGKLWTFSRDRMSDTKYISILNKVDIFKPHDFPIARAVAASTCVPFAFSPVRVAKEFFENPSNDYHRIHPRLVDGGIYDNQGIHKISHPKSSFLCDIILVSDAGIALPSKSTFTNNFTILKRTSDIFMQRIKDLQTQHNVYFKPLSSEKEIAYISLSWEVENCLDGFVKNMKNGNISNDLLVYHQLNSENLEKLDKEQIIKQLKKNIDFPKIESQILSIQERVNAQNIPTDLSALTDQEIANLSNHAAVLTEIQLKLYTPSLLKEV